MSRPSWPQAAFLPSGQQQRQHALSRSRVQTVGYAYIQALEIHSLSGSYTMALKPLAAKAFVRGFNRNFVDDVVSRDGTRLHQRRILHQFSQNAGLHLWRNRGLGYLCFVWTSPAGGGSSKEMSSSRLRRHRRNQPLLRQQPGRMAPAPLRRLPRLRPVRVPKLVQAIQRPARAPCRARQLLSRQAATADEKQNFHDLIQITVRAI